jgi:DNA-binding response OmpR family regulator
MVSKRLLVIDDDSMLRQTLSEQLRIREEFETYEAATGEAALALLKELNFDIMLMDVGLPDIDGCT